MVFEKKPHQPVPLLLEGFVQGKGTVGNPGGAQEPFVLVFQMQEHAQDVFGAEITAGALYGPLLVLGG